MNNYYGIGVDIGGTNTDAVLIDNNDNIIKAVKTATTEDIGSGFSIALKKLLLQAGIHSSQISNLFLGTTHATNAILQKRDLFRVGVIRIAGQRPEALPVAWAWPRDLQETVVTAVETIDGGFECYGGQLTAFCQRQASCSIDRLLAKGVESIAIIGVFAPLNGEQERIVGGLVREKAGDRFPISLSHEIGGIGYIERENSTILNATLRRVMENGFESLEGILRKLGFNCPLMITQNDGSVIDIQRAIEYPVLTISAGPTNSFIGGARLAGLANSIIVDIGGTSTDVGLVRGGFPLRSLNRSNIGGVSLNFPMPDVLSIALGGGSVIDFKSNRVTIGPRSVGRTLMYDAMSFGGKQLTLTDVAISIGQISWEAADQKVISLDRSQGEAVLAYAQRQINEITRKMQGEDQSLPVVLVGGGSALLPLKGLKGDCVLPAYFDVANAYGAALAKISGCIDTVVSLNDRENVLRQLCEKAQQKTIMQGANPATLRLVDQQIIPYSYVPNQMARVIIRYCGDNI